MASGARRDVLRASGLGRGDDAIWRPAAAAPPPVAAGGAVARAARPLDAEMWRIARALPHSTARSTRPLARAMAASVTAVGDAVSSSATRYKVYTKTGDAGTTSLYNGERRRKDDDFFSALGDVDELNASIGLSREYCLAARVGIEPQLVEIQCRLLDVGSAIATPALSSSAAQLERAKFHSGITASLEAWIDAMDAELPPLKNFILPVRAAAAKRADCAPLSHPRRPFFFARFFFPSQSGGLASAQLHVARTIARRAERQAVALVRDGQLAGDVAVFLNRLSDYLFVAARFATLKAQGTEEVYKKPKE